MNATDADSGLCTDSEERQIFACVWLFVLLTTLLFTL